MNEQYFIIQNKLNLWKVRLSI